MQFGVPGTEEERTITFACSQSAHYRELRSQAGPDGGRPYASFASHRTTCARIVIKGSFWPTWNWISKTRSSRQGWA